MKKNQLILRSALFLIFMSFSLLLTNGAEARWNKNDILAFLSKYTCSLKIYDDKTNTLIEDHNINLEVGNGSKSVVYQDRVDAGKMGILLVNSSHIWTPPPAMITFE